MEIRKLKSFIMRVDCGDICLKVSALVVFEKCAKSQLLYLDVVLQGGVSYELRVGFGGFDW